MQKMNKLIAIILFFIAGIFLLLPAKKFVKIPASVLSSYLSEYRITAYKQTDYEKYPIYYPPVSVLPGSIKYQLLQYYEEYQMQTGQYEPLFFATKRIQEIVTWKQSIDRKEIDSILKRYVVLMRKQIVIANNQYDEQVKNEKLEEIKRYLIQHRKKLLSITQSESNTVEKNVLIQRVSATIYKDFAKQLTLQESLPKDVIVYALSGIKRNEDFGWYRIVIDSSDVPFQYTPVTLTVGNNVYTASLSTMHDNAGLLVFPSVFIGNTTFEDIYLSQVKHAEKITTTDKDITITDILPYGDSTLQLLDDTGNAISFDFVKITGGMKAVLGTFTKEPLMVQREYLDKDAVFLLQIKQAKGKGYILGDSVSLEIVSLKHPVLQLQKLRHEHPVQVSYSQKGKQWIVSLHNASLLQRNDVVFANSSAYVLKDMQKHMNGAYVYKFDRSMRHVFYALIFSLAGVAAWCWGYIYNIWQYVYTRSRTNSIRKNLAQYFSRLQTFSPFFLLLSTAFMVFEIFFLKRTVDIIDFFICFGFLFIVYQKKWRRFFPVLIMILFILTIFLFLFGKETYRMTIDWMFLCFIFFLSTLF